MAYDMNAEGINGVQQTTYLINNQNGGGWIRPPAPPNGSLPSNIQNGFVLLAVNAVQGPLLLPTPDLAGVQCTGCGKGAGVIGQVGAAVGLFTGPGVGVAGFNVGGTQSKVDGSFQFNASTEQTAGVFGECDGGPGVKGRGGDAQATDFGGNFIPSGNGVLGVGGNSLAAAKATDKNAGNPMVPPGAGVIGVAGNAITPADDITSGTGVVGVGSGAANGFEPGRGGMFSSAGNCAQVQLVPPSAPAGKLTLPKSGGIGDLYVTVNPLPTVFLCVEGGSSTSTPAQWAPLIMGPPQPGGATPVVGQTYPPPP